MLYYLFWHVIYDTIYGSPQVSPKPDSNNIHLSLKFGYLLDVIVKYLVFPAVM